MLGGTGFFAHELLLYLGWKTAKGRVCVNGKTRIQLCGNIVSHQGFCSVP